MTQDADLTNPMFKVLAGNAYAAATTLQGEGAMHAAQDIMRDQTVGNFLGGGALPPAPGRGGFSR